MKIYILRHEIRDINDPTFYSPLLNIGIENAEKLKIVLDKHNIDLIFSSPFKRVLQTIKPYCDMKYMSVNIENSLYERIYNDTNKLVFNENDTKKNIKPTDAEYYLKNKAYKSFLPLNKIEFSPNTKERATTFLNYIIKKYKDTNYNILFATHQDIVHNMSDIYENYPMGGLCLCYNNGGKVYQQINF